MARIAGVAKGRGGLFHRFAGWYARRKTGAVPEPLGIMAHHPQVLRAVGAYEFFLERARRVDGRLKALAAIKAATRVGCPF